MFVDVAIVLFVFVVTLGAGVVAFRPHSLLRGRTEPRLWNLAEVRLQVAHLMKDGADGASLWVSPFVQDRKFEFSDTLTLMKYVTPAGEPGLKCMFPARLRGTSFAPGAGRHSPSSGWPDLAAFIGPHKVRMSERSSPPDAHWSDSFHSIQLDFGCNAEAAADFVPFFFGQMLLLRVQTFTSKLRGLELPHWSFGQSALHSTWRYTVGKLGAPVGDLKDLHLMMIQLFGLAGLVYSLAFASADWPAIHLTILDRPIAVRTFDVAFMTVFVWSVLGNVFLRRAKRFVLPISAILLVLFINASHRIMIWTLRAEIAVRSGKPRELIAPEAPGFYEHFLASQIPAAQVRSASTGIVLGGTAICLATMVRWGWSAA